MNIIENTMLNSYNVEVRNVRKVRNIMESCKITSKGQITLPKSLREEMGLKKGDVVFFKHTKDGSAQMYTTKDLEKALEKIQLSMKERFEELEINNEEDVVNMIRSFRKTNDYKEGMKKREK